MKNLEPTDAEIESAIASRFEVQNTGLRAVS